MSLTYEPLHRIAPPDEMQKFWKIVSWAGPTLAFATVIMLAFAGSTHSVMGTDIVSRMGHGHVGDEPDILNPNRKIV